MHIPIIRVLIHFTKMVKSCASSDTEGMPAEASVGVVALFDAVTASGGMFLVASVVVHLRLVVMLLSAMTYVIVLGLEAPARLKMETKMEFLKSRDGVLEVSVLPYPALQVDRCLRVSLLRKRN